MGLPDSYTVKPNSVTAYFEAMLDAEAPERFTTRFLENLGFKSTNDRLWIGVLKELGFLDTDGVPRDRYFEFLDRSRSAKVVAEGLREAYSDLFAINRNAQELATAEVRNKLRTLYKGTKKDNVISRIASTFAALSEYADLEEPENLEIEPIKPDSTDQERGTPPGPRASTVKEVDKDRGAGLRLGALQYQINIVLPESRDQAVFDAIFKSLRTHLGKPDG